MKRILAGFLILTSLHVHAQTWSTTGNAGTTPGTNFLGTTDNKELIFKTNNTERFRLSTTGYLGIGTTTPRGALDVGTGDVYLTGSPDGGPGSGNNVFLSGHIFLAPYENTNISYLQSRRLNNQGTTELRLRTYNNGNLTEAMSLQGNGNIGIGNIYPKARVHITGTYGTNWTANVPDNALLMIGGQDENFEGQVINFKNPSTNGGSTVYPDGQEIFWWSADILFGRYKNYAKWSFKENHGGGLGSSTKDILYAKLIDGSGHTNLDKIVLAPDAGNVAIGTNDPRGYKLAVNGSAIFTSAKVKLEQNWPDYVFKRDYQLLSLAELEKFIQQNNHLPEIPSAAEVAKEGLDLGGNQAALLKKIEELTLYIIEQNKEMQQMKTKMKELENKVNNNNAIKQ